MTTSRRICSPEHHDLEQARIFFDPLGTSGDFSMTARGKRLRKLADLLAVSAFLDVTCSIRTMIDFYYIQ